jgi:hypothetical protein
LRCAVKLALVVAAAGLAPTAKAQFVTLIVSPQSASVTVQAGRTAQTQFSISTSGSNVGIAVSASGSGLTGGSATAPGTFFATIDATNLTAGVYSGTLVFSCVGVPPVLLRRRPSPSL